MRSPIFCWAIRPRHSAAWAIAQAICGRTATPRYVQDDWRITPASAYRWACAMNISRHSAKIAAICSTWIIPRFPIRPLCSRSTRRHHPHRLNFAPRLGLAARLPHGLPRRERPCSAPDTASITARDRRSKPTIWCAIGVKNQINEPGGLLPVLTFENGFPQTSSTGFPSYFGVDQNARTPYVQQWSASIQQELPGSTLLEVAYIGTKGTDWPCSAASTHRRKLRPAQDLPPRPGDLQSLRTFPDSERFSKPSTSEIPFIIRCKSKQKNDSPAGYRFSRASFGQID